MLLGSICIYYVVIPFLCLFHWAYYYVLINPETNFISPALWENNYMSNNSSIVQYTFRFSPPLFSSPVSCGEAKSRKGVQNLCGNFTD